MRPLEKPTQIFMAKQWVLWGLMRVQYLDAEIRFYPHLPYKGWRRPWKPRELVKGRNGT